MRVVTIVLLALSVAACDRSSATNELTKYLDATLQGRYEDAYQSVSDADKKVKTLQDYVAEMGEQKAFAAALVAETSYEIKAVTIDGDRATAEVALTGPDFSSLFSEAMGAALVSALGDEESKRRSAEAIAEKVKSSDVPLTTVSQSFNLVKEADGWRVFLNWEFDQALADAKRLQSEEKWTEALAQYNHALELKSDHVEALKGKNDVEQEIRVLEEKRAYFQKLELKNFSVGRGQRFSFGDLEPSVFGAIVNKGDRTLDEVQLTVYFLDANGNPIAETDYHPVLVTGLSFGGDNKPLKPGYVKEFGYLIGERAPSAWSGKARAEITDIRFQP